MRAGVALVQTVLPVTFELTADTLQSGFAGSAHLLSGFLARVRAWRLGSLCM